MQSTTQKTILGLACVCALSAYGFFADTLAIGEWGRGKLDEICSERCADSSAHKSVDSRDKSAPQFAMNDVHERRQHSVYEQRRSSVNGPPQIEDGVRGMNNISVARPKNYDRYPTFDSGNQIEGYNGTKFFDE